MNNFDYKKYLAEGKLLKEDSFSGAEIDPNVELYSNDAVDWDFEESIKKIIDELKEYQKANPQDDLQTAINHLEYLIFIKEDIKPQRLGPSSQFTFEPNDPKKDLMIHTIVDEYQEKIFDYLWNYELYKNEYSKDFGY